jgi:2-polyprenyl-6-methoxyphenol hydroxylase-like FAD-dependent oxidoreductase
MAGKILISGAGVAGCCLAWWLDRYGYAVTVVEQAAAPRKGGYVIDFWGLGYDVAEKMGILDELRRHDLDARQFWVVDDSGRRISGIDQGALQDLTGGRLISLPRAAVATTLYEAIMGNAAIRFDDSVTALADSGEGVDVTFRRGPAERFDLVIGADGLHSTVRRLTFGEEGRFERFLGYSVAAFTARGYPHRNPHTT